jgi:hypothetical protein
MKTIICYLLLCNALVLLFTSCQTGENPNKYDRPTIVTSWNELGQETYVVCPVPGSSCRKMSQCVDFDPWPYTRQLMDSFYVAYNNNKTVEFIQTVNWTSLFPELATSEIRSKIVSGEYHFYVDKNKSIIVYKNDSPREENIIFAYQKLAC